MSPPQDDGRPFDRPAGAAASAKPRRIVLLQTQACTGGAQEIARVLGQGLAERGYDVHYVFFFPLSDVFDGLANTHYCSSSRPRDPMALARMFRSLIRHLRLLKPDAVLTFQHYGNVLGAPAARLAGIRTVIANRNSARELEPAWARLLDVAFGTSGVFTRIVVNSQATEDEYQRFPGAYRKRLDRIDHGFDPKDCDLTKAEARKALGLPQDVTLLGSVGRLHETKNLAAALQLLEGRDWHLALAGDGPARQSLVDLAADLGVSDRLHLMHEVRPEMVGTFLRALDVFVFPSAMETFGLAAVEAAAAGVPVVANGLPVLREVLAVNEEPAALFVDVSDKDSFARAVETVLSNTALRTQITDRGRALTARYSLDAMVDRYAALINTLLSAQSTPRGR